MVCGLAQKIHEIPESTHVPLKQAFEFGETYSQFRVVTRVMAVFFAFLIVCGALLLAGFENSPTAVTEGAIFTAVGGLGALFTVWGMKKVDQAGIKVANRIAKNETKPCEERWFWKVCSLAQEIQATKHPSFVMEFGKEYGMASSLTKSLAVIFVSTLIIGIYAAIHPELHLSYTTCFVLSGVSLIPGVYFGVRLNQVYNKGREVWNEASQIG